MSDRKAQDKRHSDDGSFPTLSRKEAIVLELLLAHTAEEMYGLQLVKESASGLKRGTIYVTLDRMEKKGYVKSRHEDKPDTMPGMPRRLYQITGYGQRVFREMMGLRDARLMFLNPLNGGAA